MAITGPPTDTISALDLGRVGDLGLELILEQFPAVLWTTDRDLRFTRSTGKGLAGLNLSVGQVVGMTLREFFGELADEKMPAYERALRGEAVAIEEHIFGRTYQSHIHPLRDADGQIVGTIGIALDITERKQAVEQLQQARLELERRVWLRTAELSDRSSELQLANEALRREVQDRQRTAQALAASQQYLSGIIEAQQTFVVRVGPNGRISYINEAYARGSGMKPGDTYQHIIHPDDIERTRISALNLTRPPFTDKLEIRCRINDQWRWIHWQSSVIRDRDGVVVEVQAVGFDITARVEAEESLKAREQHFRTLADSNRRLLNEVDHRVRNKLAGLLGLLEMMRQRASSVDELAAALRARLMAMVHVHQQLSESAWQPIAMRQLIHSLLDTVRELAAYDAPVSLDGPTLLINASQSQPLAMILVEWFTNSCKYGVHSQPGGRLQIKWSSTPADESHQVRLEWQELDGPPISGVGGQSLGTELVRSFAARELEGDAILNYPPTGAHHLLRFNLLR